MSLDRFAVGFDDLQEQPLLGICTHCGCHLYTEALHEGGKVFCDDYCYDKYIEEDEKHGIT